MLYVQDFPALSARQALGPVSRHASGTDFLHQLQRVLVSLSLPTRHPAYLDMTQYSFTHATAHLVASWPTGPTAKGWTDMERAGLPRLGRVVRMLGAPFSVHLHLEAQGSSLGAYDRRWLEQFYVMASGAAPRGLFPFTSRRGDGPTNDFQQCTKLTGWPDLQILFPTQTWVEKKSVEGRLGGGCFFGKADDFEKKQWRHLYAQPVSQRGSLMMHAKSILATFDDQDMPGWVYLGSANFTRAAWGAIAGTKDAPTLSISNWELGVVLPLHSDGLPFDPMDAVPYRRPVEPYAASDTPWDHHSGVD